MNILITGSSSGIGKSTKELFLNNGHNVYSLDIKKEEDPNHFQVDITNEDELSLLKEHFNKNNIQFDVIINIAGIHKMSSLVEDDFNNIKSVININLLGPMLINRTFHSLLKEKGRIIIVTSEVAPLDPMPFNGLYSVSKTALDSYSQALRQELNLINQKVITIRPGAIKTPLSSNSLVDTKALQESTILYKKQSHKFYNIVKNFMGKPIEPSKIAKTIYKASTTKHPKIIYQKNLNPGLLLLNLLPKRLQCFIIKGILK